MKMRFILNPRSGRNQAQPGIRDVVNTFITRHRLQAQLVVTDAAGHATQLARTAVKEDCACVVAVGGDGTMNEVAQALIDSPAALGLIPRGSGNGLALHLGIPLDSRRALDLLNPATMHAALIDTGSANGHVFINAMGLGFDAEVSRRFNSLTRRGFSAYLSTGWRAFRAHRLESVAIRSGTTEETIDAFLVAIANSDQYGNHAIIAPGARVNDGKLDLTAISVTTLIGAIRLTARLFSGTLNRSPAVRTLNGTQFDLIRNSPGIIHTDGETHATGAEIKVQVHPGSLSVVVPEKRRRQKDRKRALPGADAVQPADVSFGGYAARGGGLASRETQAFDPGNRVCPGERSAPAAPSRPIPFPKQISPLARTITSARKKG